MIFTDVGHIEGMYGTRGFDVGTGDSVAVAGRDTGVLVGGGRQGHRDLGGEEAGRDTGVWVVGRPAGTHGCWYNWRQAGTQRFEWRGGRHGHRGLGGWPAGTQGFGWRGSRRDTGVWWRGGLQRQRGLGGGAAGWDTGVWVEGRRNLICLLTHLENYDTRRNWLLPTAHKKDSHSEKI